MLVYEYLNIYNAFDLIMGGQLDEHLLFCQPAISITLYFAQYIVPLFEMQIKYVNDDESNSNG